MRLENDLTIFASLHHAVFALNEFPNLNFTKYVQKSMLLITLERSSS